VADQRRPYSRSEFNRALILNAALDPFAIVLLAGVVVAGLVLDVLALMLPVALVVYGIAAARAYFDEDEAQKVLERERARRRKVLEKGEKRLDPMTLAKPIQDLWLGALQRESRIKEAIERAELPYTEVSDEVDVFIRAMEGTARRGQLLYEALAESPPHWVEDRLAELTKENAPEKKDLVAALSNQLKVLYRMERQLQRFYDEMEKILIELDTVRGSLVSVSASTDAANQQNLAAEVRGLREEVGALAEGMNEAYEEPSPKLDGQA
jgi:hypothetical protein